MKYGDHTRGSTTYLQ